jgi:hypothetical protein
VNRYARSSAVGSGSDGSDQIGPRSNRDRWARIGGSRAKGALGGGAQPPEQSSAAASSPELAETAFQGVIRDAVWLGSILLVCAIHLCAQGSGLGTGVWCSPMRAARGGEPRRRGAIWGLQGGQGYQDLAQKRERNGIWLTRGLGGRITQRRRPVAMHGGTWRRGRRRGSPSSWVARVDAWRHCEAGKGVSWIRCATAARKPGGGVFTGGVEVLLRRS